MAVAELLRPEYESVFSAVPGNYLLLDPEFTIVGVTDAWLSATGTVRGDIIARGFFDVLLGHPDDPEAGGARMLRESLGRVLAIGRPNRLLDQRYDIRRSGRGDGGGGGFEERFWNLTNVPVVGSDGKVAFIIQSAEDATGPVRLKQTSPRPKAVDANQRLSESERHYRFLANALPQLIWTADTNGLIDYCNDRWLSFTGLSADRILGTAWHQLVHPDDRERTIGAWSQAVRTGADRYQMEHRLRCRDGAWRWMLSSATPYRGATGVIHTWLGATTDIHDRVTAEERLRQAQRLQAVGSLAGGMAHEVNNMMSVVMGFGELVLAAIGKDHPQHGDISEMVRAGARATGVTRQLLAFSRQQVLRPTVVDVNVVVAELTHALVRLLGSDRRLEVVPSPKPLRVVTDRAQIEQVLINLVLNSRDATSSGDAIFVEATAVELDAASSPAVEGEPGPYVRLVIRDSGRGMAPDVLAHAFEPFFTTKTSGNGTGLGLSMVHGVLKQSGGQVRIESVPGEGTAVSVYLPMVESEVMLSEPVVPAAPATGETVLVVEGETAARSLTRRVLEGQGYTVYQGPNAAAALDFVAEHRHELDLLLTDLVMPRMDGRELAEKIAECAPALPVLFMSEYGEEEMVQGGVSLPHAAFIPKPIRPDMLAAAVRELLAHTRTSTTA
jgi:PAS domain S-box-containing protein